MILIYTFITETVNCPERIIQLHALQHVTVFLCKLGVQHIQHGSVHFKNLILVVSECHIEIGRKLTGLDNPVRRYIEFPTQIPHFTNIPISQFGESRTRRYGDIPHQHVVRGRMIPFQSQFQTVVQKSQIHTHIIRGFGLPTKVRKTHVRLVHGIHVDISRTGTELAFIKIILRRLVAHPAPTRTYGKHGQPFTAPLHPRFVNDVPTCGNGRENTPTLIRTEFRTSVGSHGEIQRITALVRIVHGKRVVNGTPLFITGRHTLNHAARVRTFYSSGRKPARFRVLLVVVAGYEVEARHGHHRMVFILESRNERQRLFGINGHILRASGISHVDIPVPTDGFQFLRIELVDILIENIHVHPSVPS